MAAQKKMTRTRSKTTPYEHQQPSLTVALTRQHSNTTISRLIAESMWKPPSPLAPSPAGSSQVRAILERLEEVEIESRDLLGRLFSMVQTDARLHSYIRRRLESPKVSRIWELVEQILAVHGHGELDIEKMLGDENSEAAGGVRDREDGVDSFSPVEDRGLKTVDDDGVRLERFKIRTFDRDDEEVVAFPVQTAKKWG